MLVRGATPLEVLRQYMARGDSPTRGRELNIHFGGPERGFIGQISHLGDMVPVMAGVTLSFKLRGEPRVGLVSVGDRAPPTAASHGGTTPAPPTPTWGGSLPATGRSSMETPKNPGSAQPGRAARHTSAIALSRARTG